MTIGDRIALCIEMQGLSQKALAIKSNLPEPAISSYVNNKHLPNAESIKAICETLNVSADYLLNVRAKNKQMTEEETLKILKKLKSDFRSKKSNEDYYERMYEEYISALDYAIKTIEGNSHAG